MDSAQAATLLGGQTAATRSAVSDPLALMSFRLSSPLGLQDHGGLRRWAVMTGAPPMLPKPSAAKLSSTGSRRVKK
jgi:hypothetical protein